MTKLLRITTVPQSLKTLLRGQLRFMSDKFDVLAVSSDGKCWDEMIDEQGVRGVKIEMSRKITPMKDLLALFKLINLFLKERPTIVHTHTPKAGTLGMIAAWIVRVPVRLHTVAGLPLLVTTGKKRKLLDFVEKITYACATKVYPNSHEMEKLIVANGLAKKEKLKVIGNGSSNGIDTSIFAPEAEFLKVEKDSNVFNFCFVGRLVGDKGINELVRAFKCLSTLRGDVKLTLVGSIESDLDPLDDDVLKEIDENPMIDAAGFQKDVRPFLLASDALTFPSYREGFPNVVMQAGAMGLPAIVTDINGCNEIVIPNENGVIIPPKDEDALFEAMKQFVENPEEVRRMAQNARSLITSRYEQNIIWKAILKEYQSLIKEIG